MKENECELWGQTVFIKPALIFTRYVTWGKVLKLSVSPGRLEYINIFINVIVRIKQYKWKYPAHPVSGTQ